MVMSTYRASLEGKMETTTGDSLGQGSTAQMDNGVACATEPPEGSLMSGNVAESTPPCPISIVERRPPSQDVVSTPLVQEPVDYAPPVTVQTLQELELRRVITNVKLRHDVNFDPHLHFRPNTDGPRGQRKRREADAYWDALHDEFQACAEVIPSQAWAPETVMPRICRVLSEIRNILRTLVPPCDMPLIDDTLDLGLLMQQIQRSSLDYSRIAVWLSGILKAHCAPMRDAWVDEMVAQFQATRPAEHHWPLVDGIRMLFGILEAMKLDVANHQVRNLRMLLIEDTVNFEQHLCLRRIETGRLDARSARKWYGRARQKWLDQKWSGQPISVDAGPVAGLLLGLTEALSASDSMDLPETFAIDADRLQHLRAELHDLIALEICVKVFELSISLHEDHHHRRGRIPDDVVRELRLAILALVNDTGGRILWRRHIGDFALEMGRLAHKLQSNSSYPDRKIIAYIEDRLERYLTIECRLWQHCEDAAMRYIGRETLKHTQKFLSLPLLAVADAATTRGPDAATSTFETLLSDIAKRLAHVACLHWRVFGSIVYLREEEEEDDDDDNVVGSDHN